MPGRSSIILSNTFPQDLALDLDSAAKQEMRSRSELVREAVRQYVLAAKWKALRQKAALKAAVQGLKEEDIERLLDEYDIRGTLLKTFTLYAVW